MALSGRLVKGSRCSKKDLYIETEEAPWTMVRALEDLILIGHPSKATQRLILYDFARENSKLFKTHNADCLYVRQREPGYDRGELRWMTVLNMPRCKDYNLGKGALVGPGGRGIHEITKKDPALFVWITIEPLPVIFISGNKLASVKECVERTRKRVQRAVDRRECFYYGALCTYG